MTARGQVVALYYMAISLSGLFLFGALPLLGAARTLSLYLEALARQK